MDSDIERDWGRPYGRPFDPQLLTIEEWLLLSRSLPSEHNREYYSVVVPENLSATEFVPDKYDCESTIKMNTVLFRAAVGYVNGWRHRFWVPQGASDEVRSLLRYAGKLNPIGEYY